MTATPAQTEATSLWRNGDFLRFWFGETVSLLGSQVTALALPLTAISAFQATDEQVGVLRFLQLVPYLGLALLFGVWVDRSRRRHVMLSANLARLVLIGLVPLLYFLDLLTLPLLLALACAIGIASVLFDVSWMAYVPTLVKGPSQYVEAGAKLSMSSSAADVAGPGLAGLLISAATAPIALVVDAISYLASVLSLLTIRTPERRPDGVRRKVGPDLREGLGWVFGNPLLRWLALIGFCCNFSMITVWTLFLLFGTHDLRLSAGMLGIVFSSASVGGLLGAVSARRVIQRFPLGRAYLTGQTMLLLGPGLLLLAPGFATVPICIASFFVTYLGLGVAGVIIVSLRQTLTPQHLMARMTAAFRTLLFGGGALGGLAAGVLSGAVGTGTALLIIAGASASMVVPLLFSPVVRLQRLPDPPGA
ncbi:MFS transporter [Kribbella sancticallisti]|uniref:MFS transporter n=1 Tax=Kribbella sancticallisti TaxID=460087 RepID=A0ABP4PMM1_9ACTN